MTIKFANVPEIQMRFSHKMPAASRPKISSSQDAWSQLLTVWTVQMDYVEEFYILTLDRANKVTGYFRASMGGMCGTVVDVRILFQVALKAHANGIILAHNHPSGNRQPSEADIKLTKQIKEAGKFLDISVIDHIILTADNGYFSFADEGMM